jgi:plasmid stabilization system protein ParE
VKWQVSIRRAAANDIRLAMKRYEAERVGLGDRFALAVADALSSLEILGDRLPLYYRDFRRVLTKTFPYKVFYRVDGASVVVFRILHSARDHRKELR